MACYANAREFLRAVEARYRALDAYSDRGIVYAYARRPRKADVQRLNRDRLVPGIAKRSFEQRVQSYRSIVARLRGEPLMKEPFETAYRNTGEFRVVWTRAHPYPPLRHRRTLGVVGRDAQGAYVFLRRPDGKESLRREDSLDLAVAASSSAAQTISALLFGPCHGGRLLELRRIRFRGMREIDGVDCLAVSGLGWRGGRVTAWFGTGDLMLRRLVEHRSRHEERRFDVRTADLDPAIDFKAPVVAEIA